MLRQFWVVLQLGRPLRDVIPNDGAVQPAEGSRVDRR